MLTRAADLPDAVVRYAGHDDALVDVYLPPRHLGSAPGPAPLLVFLHGGFWRHAFDRRHVRPLALACAAEGFVVALPEYRRVGGTGPLAGGWPATVEDVTAAMAALPGLLDGLGIATASTTVAGHSAGGHLALWLANERLPVDRVVALAPVSDLRAAARDHLGDDAAQAFLGGEPDEVPERYDAADPMLRLDDPPSCDVMVLHGTEDQTVPAEHSRGLVARHRDVRLVELDGYEHLALVDPLSGAWPEVLMRLLDGAAEERA